MISLKVIPSMKCDSGCGDCCGIVICKPHEYQAIKQYSQANGIEPKKQGLTCPWYQDGTCKVYEVRPFVCRLFGHVERLTCSRGYNTNIHSGLEKRLSKQYGEPSMLLHQIFPDFDIDTLAKQL